MFKLTPRQKTVGAAAAAISAAGVLFIAGREGKENEAYPDIAGVWTICYGSTGAHAYPGARLTDADCLTLLDRDLDRFEAAVNRCTPAPKNQNEFDALVSLSYNIGETAYCNSTLARKFNAGDKQGAADQFLRWDKARVRGVLVTVRGLTLRRQAERRLFLTEPEIRAAEGITVAPAQAPTDSPERAPRGGNQPS